MTNEQVNASRFVALRNPGCVFDVSDRQITVSCDGNEEVVSFTSETPASTLRRDLEVAVARVSSGG
ncbi:MAG: hypothetical protein NXH88_09225 [Hyphomonas sp.]|nr:hypothetical protein [Hyphomonas sp.]